MNCPMCGHAFDDAAARTACGGCAIIARCVKVRCPNCNYEWPREPRWIGRLRAWMKGRHARSHQ